MSNKEFNKEFNGFVLFLRIVLYILVFCFVIIILYSVNPYKVGTSYVDDIEIRNQLYHNCKLQYGELTRQQMYDQMPVKCYPAFYLKYE